MEIRGKILEYTYDTCLDKAEFLKFSDSPLLTNLGITKSRYVTREPSELLINIKLIKYKLKGRYVAII